MMTGSGSGVFGLFHTRQAATLALDSLKGAGRARPVQNSLVSRQRYRSLWWRAPQGAYHSNNMAAPKPVSAMTNDRLKIFTGNANPALAQEICQALGMELGRAM